MFAITHVRGGCQDFTSSPFSPAHITSVFFKRFDALTDGALRNLAGDVHSDFCIDEPRLTLAFLIPAFRNLLTAVADVVAASFTASISLVFRVLTSLPPLDLPPRSSDPDLIAAYALSLSHIDIRQVPSHNHKTLNTITRGTTSQAPVHWNRLLILTLLTNVPELCRLVSESKRLKILATVHPRGSERIIYSKFILNNSGE